MTIRKRRTTRPASNKTLAVGIFSARNLLPRSAEEFFAKSEQFQDRLSRVEHAVGKMRADKLSLHQAAREFGLSPRTVIRIGGSALRKHKDGRYVAKSHDHLLRVLVIQTKEGLREVAVNDSREASLAGRLSAAIERYLQTGDASALRRIRRKTILTADRKRVRLLKELDEIDRLGSAGVLSFETLYGKVS